MVRLADLNAEELLPFKDPKTDVTFKPQVLNLDVAGDDPDGLKCKGDNGDCGSSPLVLLEFSVQSFRRPSRHYFCGACYRRFREEALREEQVYKIREIYWLD